MGKIKFLPFLLLAFLLLSALSCGTPAPSGETAAPETAAPETDAETLPPAPEGALLHTIAELNTGADAIDGHAGEQANSSLELDRRSVAVLTAQDLKTTLSYYYRIKKRPDGGYILFYSACAARRPNVKALDICCILSDDLITWSEPITLAKSAGSSRNYATADALFLQNGDLLAVYSYRPKEGYETDLCSSGLEIRRSADGGRTWSEPQRIYTGMNWEPNLLQDDDGTVYCAFTHTAPYVHYYGYNKTIRSSGSAIIRSTDNGVTWTPDVTGPPFEARRVIQDYVGDLDGLKIMNDQMPVLLKLHNGRYMIACERQEINGNCYIDIGYTDTLDYSLGLTEVGPADRLTRIFRGIGPYLAQFPSGETVLTYGRGGFNAAIAGADGKGFGSAQKPFASVVSTSRSQATELLTSHSLLAACEKIRDNQQTDLVCGVLYLNHRIDAGRMTATPDGSAAEWAENTDALFLGSESQAQASFRFGCDADTVSILVERLDDTLDWKGDCEELFLAPSEKGPCYRVTADAGVVRSAVRLENGSETPVTLTGASLLVTEENAADPSRRGWITELVLDRGALGFTGDVLYFNAILYNTDGKEVSAPDTFSDCRAADPATWKPVRLAPAN